MKKQILPFLILICLAIVLVILPPKENKIKEYNKEEIELAIYINEEETNTIPSEEGNIYDETRSSCTNGAYIIWDYETWSPVIKNMNEYKTRCELYFKTGYKESILNGMDPVLEEPLIPVTIESDGTVKKADIGSEWYNYENKEWANAVILFDESEDYLAGEIIPEEKIESYFVWIPKYRYQLWDLGLYDSVTTIDTSKVHEIPIIFGDYNTNDVNEGECTTPMESGATGNCVIGDYMTHPAFLSIPSTGFWVGKFETGYVGATSPNEAEQNVNDSSKIIVKPNVYSWGNIQISNAHLNSYNYKRNLDSHMMKNTEWGAVAYLQHSTYGSAASVRINNNTACVTGYAANNEPTCGYTGTNIECNIQCDDGTCNTAYPNSILASTTGNISGIYDMSGGSHEYVMAILTTDNGELISGYSNSINSGFNGICIDGSSVVNGVEFPDSKYYDIYQYSDKDSYFFYRLLGDAIGEMGPFYDHTYPGSDLFRVSSSWYNDIAHTLHTTAQFISRGAANVDGNAAGIFGFYPWNGSELYTNISFRIILTPAGDTS